MHRKHRSRTRDARQTFATQTHALLVIGSFAAGIALEWARTRFVIFEQNWRAETVVILLAAWAGVALLTWWPQGTSRALPRLAAIMLAVLFLGTLITHQLLYHG